MAGTILRLGWTNPLTDGFGAHPVLGAVVDLNDGVTFTLVSPEGLELPPPKRTLVPAGNIRTQGERVTRAIYAHNREVVARLVLGPGASPAAFLSSLRTLVRWLNAPPAVPITLQYQPYSPSSVMFGTAHAGYPSERRRLHHDKDTPSHADGGLH